MISYVKDIVRKKIYNSSYVDEILKQLQKIAKTPESNIESMSVMFFTEVQNMYQQKIDGVMNEVVDQIKKFNANLLSQAPESFKGSYQESISTVDSDIQKLVKMRDDKSSKLTESQKEQISTIEKNKQLEEVMQIFKKISIKETDESIKSTVALFIVSNIIDLVTDDLTEKNQTTQIQDFKGLLDIINGTPSIDKIVAAGGKNKNKSKKNKQSNKRKTKRRKSANSKKIKFTKVKTL